MAGGTAISKLTQEEKASKIASYCKWRRSSFNNQWLVPREPREQSFFVGDPFADLNAMHEAEKMLSSYKQISQYMWELERLTGWKPDYREGGDGKQYISPSAYYCTTHATAAERAEAFGKTLNLW